MATSSQTASSPPRNARSQAALRALGAFVVERAMRPTTNARPLGTAVASTVPPAATTQSSHAAYASSARAGESSERPDHHNTTHMRHALVQLVALSSTADCTGGAAEERADAARSTSSASFQERVAAPAALAALGEAPRTLSRSSGAAGGSGGRCAMNGDGVSATAVERRPQASRREHLCARSVPVGLAPIVAISTPSVHISRHGSVSISRNAAPAAADITHGIRRGPSGTSSHLAQYDHLFRAPPTVDGGASRVPDSAHYAHAWSNGIVLVATP